MKQTSFWLWSIPDDRKPGRLRKTTYRMTEADALARHPTAKKVEGSEELRLLPETDEERAAFGAGSLRRSS